MEQLALLVVLAVLGQLAARLLRIPAILVLLLVGMAAGGWLGWIRPDELFGDLLFPGVDLAVAVILFEGGLLLNFRELRGDLPAVVRRLLTWGVVLTGVGAAAAGHLLLDMSWPVAVVFGAILTVSGPTVVVPLLRFVGATESVESVLKWEGVFIDAIGATLAVLAYETVRATGGSFGPQTLLEVGLTLLVGVAVGLAVAAVLVWLLHWDAVDEHLASLASLGAAMAAFVAADLVRHEAGLMAAIVLGVALANQGRVSVAKVAKFKETLGTLLTSLLFVVLAARLDLAELQALLVPVAAVVAILVVLVRPFVVWVSTAGSQLPGNERAFVGWMAPRGIVAAATASVFGTGLVDAGMPSGEDLVPATFLVILGTVAVYGLTAKPVARLLDVVRDDAPAPEEVADQAGSARPDDGPGDDGSSRVDSRPRGEPAPVGEDDA